MTEQREEKEKYKCKCSAYGQCADHFAENTVRAGKSLALDQQPEGLDHRHNEAKKIADDIQNEWEMPKMLERLLRELLEDKKIDEAHVRLIKSQIGFLLTAQKEGMECKHDKPTLHVPSKTISMEDHNKQIIDVVERFASDIRFSNDELIGLGNDLAVKACLKFNQRIDAYLPDFKREYGGKE